MKVLVLGAGRIGTAIARDLAADPDFDVGAADDSPTALAPLPGRGVAVHVVDLSRRGAVAYLSEAYDLVIGAVPGALGFKAARAVLEAGRDLVDISFFAEDPFVLDALARDRGRVAVVDAGVAPGLSNLMLGRALTTLEEPESFRCLVGGLPAEPVGAWGYRAPFSPADVIEEYTRPARLRVDGRELTVPALSLLELVDLPGVGTLEAFVTDGLRTLLQTTTVPSIVEKTLRYPGHAAKVALMRDTGFFDLDPLAMGDASIAPRALSLRLLEEAWAFKKGEEDLTVMRVEVVGREDGVRVRHSWDLLDRYDRATATSSMARVTGYTCTSLVRWLASTGRVRAGLVPPESLAAEPGCFDFVLACLEERGVQVHHQLEELTEDDPGSPRQSPPVTSGP